MGELVLIINKHTLTWIPPRFGEFYLAVEQYSKVNETIVHFCCEEVDRSTIMGHKYIPAIYTVIKDGVCTSNQLEYIKLDINGPVHFYFTNQNNEIMEGDTPFMRLLIKY